MRKVLFVAALFTLVLTPMAFAGSTSGTLTVNATVAAKCTIDSPTLNFGTYDALAATDATGSGTITVKCTKGNTPKITLAQGSHVKTGSTDTTPLRQMAQGTEYLAYFLYQPDGTTVWGNTAATGFAPAVSLTGTAVTINGTITAAQDVTAGAYTDSVVATLNF